MAQPTLPTPFLKAMRHFRVLTDREPNALPAFESIRIIWALGLAASLRKVNGERWFSEFFQRGMRMLYA